MNTPRQLDWKVAATAGAIAGVAIGGFVLAAPGSNAANPDGIVLQEHGSVGRLSAPVVIPTTSIALAEAASVATPVSSVPTQVSAPSPIASRVVAPPAAEPSSAPSAPSAPDIASAPSAPSAPDIASAPSAPSAPDIASAPSAPSQPAPPPAPVPEASAASPVSPASPASPASPTSVGSVGSGASS